MHHAIAGWPAWSEYAEIVGGSFLYVPGELRGEKRKDSGYRHEVEHTVTRLTDHALTRNLPSEFSMTDELYLYEVFEDSVIPILASQHEFSAGNFYSAAKVVLEGKMFNNDNWDHDTGSNLVAWVKNYANSPIAYIQGGDDPVVWQSSEYQQLVRNAITWAASNEALTWARQRP